MREFLYRASIAAVIMGIMVSSLRYVADFWLFSFFYSFQIHIAVLCLATMLLVSMVRWRNVHLPLILASSALLAHGIIMQREFAATIDATAAASAKHYRLMSFNILGDNFENADRITDEILSSGADVVYVLEAGPLRGNLARLEELYPNRIGCGNQTPGCDLMMLSKRPFIDPKVLSLGELRKDRYILTGIDLDGTPVTFAAAHLSKPYFDDLHEEETANLAASLRTRPGPLLLAGDFNSGIMAPDMQRLARDAHLKTGPSEPATWPIPAGDLGISIDHILARAPVQILSTTRLSDSFGSNHYGLIADFVVEK